MGINQPILYVGKGQDSKMAVTLLERAGFEVEVHDAPNFYEIAYGTPVLFGLSNRFEGLEGIQIFIANARILGYAPCERALARGV